MRIVFVNQPRSPRERYGELAVAGSYSPPTGLLSLAAVARRAGHEAVVIDAQARALDLDGTLALLKEAAPDVVAMTAYTSTFPSAAAVARGIREALTPGPAIVMGGPHITALPAESLAECPAMDYAAVGEGEETLLELLDRVGAGVSAEGLAGIISRGGEGVRTGSPRPFIADLDTLPFPAWDLLRDFPRAYAPQLTGVGRGTATSVITSRGCPKQCHFCDRSVFGARVRANSAGYMVEMLAHLRDRFGIRCFVFEDDNLVSMRPRLRAFCELAAARLPGIAWTCQASADMLDPALLPLMKRAGCRMVNFGIESGSQKILDLMGKRVRVAQMEEAVRQVRAHGILTRGLMIAGYFGETRETMEETLAFLRRCRLDDISWHYFTPFPGSRAWGEVRKHGSFKPDWARMNLYHPTFVPNGLRAKDLTLFIKKSYRQFYFRPSTIASYLRRIAAPGQFAHLARSAAALLRYVLTPGGRES